MTRLSSTFAKGRPALINVSGRGGKDIFTVAEHLGVVL